MAITVTSWLQANTWTLTLANVTAADTLTITAGPSATSQTETANASPGAHQFLSGSTDTAAAASLATLINTDFGAAGLVATSVGPVVTIVGPMTAYSVGAGNTGTYLLAAVGLPSQPVPMNVSVSTSGGVVLQVLSAYTAVSPSGLNYRATSVNAGVFALAPGQNTTVPTSGSLVLPTAVTPFAQLNGATNLYSVSVQVETSDGSFTTAPAITLSVTGAVVG